MLPLAAKIPTIIILMAKSKERKKDEVKRITEKLAKMKISIFTSYTGLKVKDLNQLRNELRKEGIDYQAAKKSLIKLAFSENKLKEIDLKALEGSLGLAFGYEDEVKAPKLLEKFKKEHEQLQILGGLYDGEFITREKVLALAKVPGKQELLTQLVWAMKGPISSFNRLLSANLSGLINVLNQIKDNVTT